MCQSKLEFSKEFCKPNIPNTHCIDCGKNFDRLLETNGCDGLIEKDYKPPMSIPEKAQYASEDATYKEDSHEALTFGEIAEPFGIQEGDDPRNKSMRFNAGKPQVSMVMSAKPAIEGIARVMEFGAKKYERDNWKKGLDTESILDSMLRHINSYLDGEYYDEDSGLPHIDHIGCNALFLGYHTDRESLDGRK